MSSQTLGIKAADAVATKAKALVAEVGEKEATARLGVAPATVARLVGGLRVQPSTLLAAATILGVDVRGMIADPVSEPADDVAAVE